MAYLVLKANRFMENDFGMIFLAPLNNESDRISIAFAFRGLTTVKLFNKNYGGFQDLNCVWFFLLSVL
jgi:hypothetical protein